MKGGRETQATHRREGQAGQNVRLGGKMGDTSRSPTISTKSQAIAQQAINYPEMVFTTLAHDIAMAWLGEAYRRTNQQGAAGIEGVTAEE